MSKILLSIYLDLSKALDILDHTILSSKFIQELIGRKQYAYFNNIESDREHLTTGVPQGYVLGPLLFLVSINETFAFNIIVYADDTILFSDLNLIPEARGANSRFC